MKCLLFILLLSATLFAWDMQMYLPPGALKSTVLNEEEKVSQAKNENLDSIKIYKKLIQDEYYKSIRSQNVTGMVVGGVLTGLGTVILIAGVQGVSDSESDNDWGGNLASVLISALSYPFFMVGLPVFTYNLIYYNIHKSHERKALEYEKALNRYLQKKNDTAIYFSITPIVNVYNGSAGARLFVGF